MLEIFSLLMAHGYSGAGAVFQMPASATDVDVLCSRSCYCRPFSSFFLSLGYICFWCFGSACYPSIKLLIFILFVIVASPSLPFAIFVRLWSAVPDFFFLVPFRFFSASTSSFFLLSNFLFFLLCLCSLPSVPATKRFSLPMAFTNLYSHDLINDFLQSFNQHYWW